MFKKISLLILFITCSSFSTETPSLLGKVGDGLMEKFHDAIADAYETAEFELEEITVPMETAEKVPSEMNHQNLFKILSGGKLIGYAYLGEAPSKKRMFDYAVFFTPELIIKKSKVLIYREDYGRQIGTRRWLSQFKGMSSKKKAVYGKNVAAISGSTISATSMTRAVNAVLESVGVLQKQKLIGY
ncbi:MAG TPA: FMN-binding protein [Flavobacteriaceae bacterium]|nr:FMN-binding protein [Flavobacteriaceae bacterium]